MNVSLYKYTGENNRVDKSSLLSTPVTITANYGYEGNQNIEQPSIIIQSSATPDYNYCYIDTYGLYYFITNKTWISADLWRLTLKADPLYSGKDGILAQSGTVLYSGLGSTKKYDPRIVFNEPPQRNLYTSTTLPEGGNWYILMTCRYTYYPHSPLTYDDAVMSNQMSYILMSKQAYAQYVDRIMYLTNSGVPFNEQIAVAITNTIVSVSMVKWLNTTGLTTPADGLMRFASLEIFKINGDLIPFGLDMNHGTPLTPYEFYQLKADDYYARTYITFSDSVYTYAQRKAQRLIDIPYIGQFSVDFDHFNVPLSADTYHLICSISYDLGGNEYVVVPGYYYGTETAANAHYLYEDHVTFSNTYTCAFFAESSYVAEQEQRTAQILSLMGTLIGGIATGIATEGATVPATIASLGIGAANFALSEQKMQYQKASSFVQKGSSNGGSAYNTFPYMVSTTLNKPKATLYTMAAKASTNVSSFQTAFGKPDGEYRLLSTLSGTGWCQLGVINLTGFANMTNVLKNEIKESLLNGVIL